MAITGIHSLTYATSDLDEGVRFHEGFGLKLVDRRVDQATFRLADGSTVVLVLSHTAGHAGVQEVCWAVDTRACLHALANEVAKDRSVERVGEEECAFADDAGLRVRLLVAQPLALRAAADPLNAPGRIERWNTNRTWYDRAVPKQFQHVVFCNPQPRAAARFYVQRLGFRISDVQEEGGIFLRADGSSHHHNLYWQVGPATIFRHVSYGVDSIDELMAGAARMKRLGYESALGLGRHRISSTFFYYLPNPCGGESEYSTDSDCLNDEWQPRVWGRAFGHIWWLAKPREQDPPPNVRPAGPQDLHL